LAGMKLSDRRLDTLVAIAPTAASIVAMMTLTLNLWLAAKITATSGRLHRPWPDLKSTALPPLTLAALCIAIAFCFSGGLLAIVAQIIAAALMIAYTFTGFAVLHTLTLALKGRAIWLGCAYIVVLVLSWAILAIAVLGIADAVFGLRQRYLRRRPPPLPAS
jgi:membrane-associated HD superfamily phosphohydrolase